MDDRKVQYALIAGLAYLVLSYPATYKLTNSITTAVSPSLQTSNSAGCPTMFGLLAHGGVVAGLVYALLMQNIIVPLPAKPPVMF